MKKKAVDWVVDWGKVGETCKFMLALFSFIAVALVLFAGLIKLATLLTSWIF